MAIKKKGFPKLCSPSMGKLGVDEFLFIAMQHKLWQEFSVVPSKFLL
jgi:hypothetical protein